jgi:hypothetical protein
MEADMNRRGSLPAVTAWSLVAILAASCVGVEAPTPAPTDAPTPSTTSPTATPTPSPSPSPTPAPPSPTVAPTATPTPVSGDVVLAGFVDFLKREPDFHLICTVAADIYADDQSDQLFVLLDGDISGQDFAGYMSMQTTGVTVEADMVVIGDVVYVRLARGDWTPGEEFAQTQPLNPFTSDIADAFTYQGPVTIDGQALHDLNTTTWIGGDIQKIGRQNGLRRPKLESSVFDIFVNDDGLPVTSLLEFAVTGRYRGVPVRFEYTVIYDFSQIGEPVTIEAPI